jgi:ATP-dependent RNA helicase SrmB
VTRSSSCKRERVHELAEQLRAAGINNCYLEGEMAQAKRVEGIKRLTDGRAYWLPPMSPVVSIPDVSHVFNFDMPRSGDTYLHRIGRTGRAGRKGPRFHWSKPTIICCCRRLVATLKSR